MVHIGKVDCNRLEAFQRNTWLAIAMVRHLVTEMVFSSHLPLIYYVACLIHVDSSLSRFRLLQSEGDSGLVG